MDPKFYLDFENKFRGDRTSVVEKLSCYDKLIELIIKDIERPKFLDIGCGRGEWLERWSQRVPDSWGIESDSSMTRLCRNKGLNIIEENALDALEKLSSKSISVITIFHMVEHLEYTELMKLLLQCSRVLADNGLIIIETPMNVLNVGTSLNKI